MLSCPVFVQIRPQSKTRFHRVHAVCDHWLEEQAFIGNDVSGSPQEDVYSQAECLLNCETTVDCEAMSFEHDKDRCYLKSGMASTTLATQDDQFSSRRICNPLRVCVFGWLKCLHKLLCIRCTNSGAHRRMPWCV